MQESLLTLLILIALATEYYTVPHIVHYIVQSTDKSSKSVTSFSHIGYVTFSFTCYYDFIPHVMLL